MILIFIKKMNNNWKLLQDYIKKINLTSFDLIGKEKQLEKDFDSYVNLFYKYKKKIRKINDNNINILGLDESINQNLIKKKIKVTSEDSDLNFYILIKNYLLEFRDNLELLFNFISLLNKDEQKIISKILVHYFFEDVTKNGSSHRLNNFISKVIIKNSNDWDIFLNDYIIEEKSFLSLILNEYIYRHEIKIYLKSIFKDLIRNLFIENNDANYITFSFSELSRIIGFEKKIKGTKNNSPMNRDSFSKIFTKTLNKISKMDDNEDLKFQNNLNILNKIPSLNEKYLRNLLKNETNELKKFLINKQLLIASNLGKTRSSNYYSNETFINIIKRTANKELILSKYIKNMENVIKFFNDFITKLKKYSFNIPNIIKTTIKTFYNQINKKFPSKSKYEINSFIIYYFINYLIIPFLKFPEANELLYNKIDFSPFNHKSLESIIFIFKQISLGNLFNNELNYNYTNLNQMILKIIYELHQFFTNVIFNEEKKVFEDDYKTEEKEIYKTFCLSKPEIGIFLNKYDDIKNNLKSQNAYAQMISNKNFILEDNDLKSEFDIFYIFIYRNYDKSREQKIKIDFKKDIISQTTTNYINEIKICINNVFSNIPTLSEKANSFSIEELFNIINLTINYYKEEYKNILISDTIPLSWYSNYIVQNINKLPDDYKNENYNKLYIEMFQEEDSHLKTILNKKLIISTELSSEIASIKKNISILKNDLKNVDKCYIKTILKDFIKNAEIKVCLINELEKKEFIYGKKITNKEISNKKFTLQKMDECIHGIQKILKLAKNLGVEYNKIIGHCYTIKDFINKILQNKEDISFDIYMKNNHTKTKEIIELYLQYAEKVLNNDNKFEHYFIYKNKDKIEENKGKFLKEIKRFIITEILNHLEIKEIEDENNSYNIKIRTSLWIKLEDFKIDIKKTSQNQINMALQYIKNMDNEIYYLNVLKALLKAINIIIKMFQFTSGKEDSSVEDFLPILLYLIIQSKPYHLIFNLKVAKYFITSSDLNSMYGYTLTNLETCVNYLNTISYQQFNYSKEEFYEKCGKSVEDSMKQDFGDNYRNF